MDHTDVLDRLDAAFVGPGKLWSIEADTTGDGAALREHLADCPACRTEYDALLATAAVLAAGAPESLRPADGARERLIEHVHELGVPRGASAPSRAGPATPEPVQLVRRDVASPGRRAATSGRPGAVPLPAERATVVPFRSRRRSGVLAGLAVAAAVVLLVAGAAIDRVAFPQTDGITAIVRQLADATSSMDRMLADPGHREVRLQTASSMDGGSLLVSADRSWLVVVSDALREPPSTDWYACYLERGGQRTPLGWMQFAQDLAYWDGPIKGPADLGRPGDRFIVVLEPGNHAPELTATF